MSKTEYNGFVHDDELRRNITLKNSNCGQNRMKSKAAYTGKVNNELGFANEQVFGDFEVFYLYTLHAHYKIGDYQSCLRLCQDEYKRIFCT